MNRIPYAEFEHRLAQLCTRRGGPGLPRKRRDQHILLISIALTFERDRAYSETAINDRITDWLNSIGRLMETDHVTLRRHLVDEGYLVRDDAGASYQVNETRVSESAESDVLKSDPVAIMTRAYADREAQKQKHQNHHYRSE